MKSVSLALAIVLFGFNSMAGSLTCILNEFKEGKSQASEVIVEDMRSGHQGMALLKPILFPEISGYISFLEKNGNLFAVVSFHSETIQVNSSSQYQLMMDQQYLQHQLVVPTDDIQLAGIELACMYNNR